MDSRAPVNRTPIGKEEKEEQEEESGGKVRAIDEWIQTVRLKKWKCSLIHTRATAKPEGRMKEKKKHAAVCV